MVILLGNKTKQNKKKKLTRIRKLFEIELNRIENRFFWDLGVFLFDILSEISLDIKIPWISVNYMLLRYAKEGELF